MKKKSTFYTYPLITILLMILSITVTACANPFSSSEKNSIPETLTTEAAPPESAPASVPSTLAETKPIFHTDTDFVKLTDYIPNAVIDLKYATPDNFTGCAIYNFTDAYLRYGTTIKLLTAAKQLDKLGYRIKIWDAFRPFEAQIALWNAYPNGNYVANPQKGYTSHNLGNTVDITLVTLDGKEVSMPTNFDDFTAKANRDYSDVSAIPATNATTLETIMTNCGFKGYSNEWWHFEDTVLYQPDESFLPPVTQ